VPDQARPRGAWSLLVAALSCLPVLGVFTTTRIFFVRDLSFFFWSRHLWLRHTIFSGQAPWWDPYVASGQSAIADALNQLVMPVTLAIRLLPSDVVSFNLWVALPLPVAGLGMFQFLRRRTTPAGAALGACVFALSGAIVSMLNTPNLAWSVALMPWVLSGVGVRGSFVRVAAAFALQALCGEPVTWAATGALAVCYAMGGVPSRSQEASIFRRTAVVVAALGVGSLLASAQLVPTVLAGVRAHRSALATPDFWSLHPVSLWEAVAPNLFGNYYDAFLADLPWMRALNFGRDPFFYSLYVGPLVLLLALAGAASAFRRNAFWVAVSIAALAAALGGYTPLYPLLRKLIPQLMYFRFPVKYVVVATFACAVLASEGWSAIARAAQSGERLDESSWLRTFVGAVSLLAIVGLAVALASLATPDVVVRGTHWVAATAHLKDPSAGAAFLARTAPPLASRFFVLLSAGCVLAAAATRHRHATTLLFAAVCADLAITNARLNLTMEVSKLTPPAWYTASAGPQRVYIGGRVRGFMNGDDPDGVKTWQIPAEETAIEGRMELNAELPMAPSGWRVREALSYDLPYLWPAGYEATVRRFEQADREERAAFLRRSGVRRCVLPEAEPRQYRVVADVRDWNMRVFECDNGATRLYFASSVSIARDPADLAWQREALFDPAARDDAVRLAAAPGTPAAAGSLATTSLRFVDDLGTSVTVETTSRDAGLMVLRDTYDPSWTATVDGVPAPILRANGLHRAVALPPGQHVIRFSYRPRDFMIGLILSVTTGLTVIALAAFPRRRGPSRRGSTENGFTLIELMIVLAIIGILLAIAFTEYRGMQAKGNDASAVGSLRSIAAAQWQFALTCANGKYSTTLPGLGQPVPVTGHAFLSPDLTAAETFEKSGYMFQLAAKPLENAPPACNGAAVADGYAATADPVKPGVSGNYFYGVNADRVLYVDEQQTYTGNLGESGPAGHGGEVK
jgi:prepilin-type N-terminal cleavage/methylation domain-containing protein